MGGKFPPNRRGNFQNFTQNDSKSFQSELEHSDVFPGFIFLPAYLHLHLFLPSGKYRTPPAFAYFFDKAVLTEGKAPAHSRKLLRLHFDELKQESGGSHVFSVPKDCMESSLCTCKTYCKLLILRTPLWPARIGDMVARVGLRARSQ